MLNLEIVPVLSTTVPQNNWQKKKTEIKESKMYLPDGTKAIHGHAVWLGAMAHSHTCQS